ncbi:MAG TPA: hypothetical protein VJ583_02925 [Nitrososphaeraceae archaeon]|nr:hypothetical protein [Nitrososphaeraceae archaeon]
MLNLSHKSFKETEDNLEDIINKYPEGETGNPILLVLDALTLKASKEPDEKITAEIFKNLQSLDNRLGIIQNQLIRQVSDNPFNPTHELFSPEEANERSKNLAWNIIASFIHKYDIEKNLNNDKKKKEE